jgi:hypothetical protein
MTSEQYGDHCCAVEESGRPHMAHNHEIVGSNPACATKIVDGSVKEARTPTRVVPVEAGRMEKKSGFDSPRLQVLLSSAPGNIVDDVNRI